MADPAPRRPWPIADTARGLLCMGGIGLLGYGAWLHYQPLGFMVGGGLIAGLGLLATLRAR